MPLARLQVPHGGATKMPTQFGEDNHCLQMACPAVVVKSAVSKRPELFCRLWSTPKDDLRPKNCKHVVTLAEPAHTSMKKGSAGENCFCTSRHLFCCLSLGLKSSWVGLASAKLEKCSSTCTCDPCPSCLLRFGLHTCGCSCKGSGTVGDLRLRAA